MSYQVTERLQHKVEIAAQLEPEVVERERKALLRSWSGKARIPGFRPGKAPLAILQARFGDQVQGELIEKLAAIALQEVLEGEDNLRPLGPPEVTKADLEPDGGFSLGAEMEVRPEIELRPIEELTLPEVSVEVSDDEVEQEVEKLQKEQAAWEPADDEPAADGMRVDCTFHGETVDDGEVIVHEENAGFIIGHPELYQEINEAMQGAKTGDTCSATERFEDDDPDPGRAGKNIRFDVTIKGLKREELPPADDELATAVGLESFEQLQERIKEALQQQKIEQRRERWRKTLLEQISEGFDINTLPTSLVQSAVDGELEHLEQLFKQHGGDSGNFDRQRFATDIEPSARRKVVDMLILNQLAEEWQISADEQLDRVVQLQAERIGIPAPEHRANLKKQGKLDEMSYNLRLAGAVSELIRRAGGEE